MGMSLTKADLRAIKKLFDVSFDERVPKIIDERVPAIIDERVPKIMQPMLDRLEQRLTDKIDQLTLNVGQFSLETTNNFIDLERRLGDRIEVLSDKLTDTVEMCDTNRVEIAKVKRKLGLT